jgi:hypothetical protein
MEGGQMPLMLVNQYVLEFADGTCPRWSHEWLLSSHKSWIQSISSPYCSFSIVAATSWITVELTTENKRLSMASEIFKNSF